MGKTFKNQLEEYKDYGNPLPLKVLEEKLAMAKAFNDNNYIDLLGTIVRDIRGS